MGIGMVVIAHPAAAEAIAAGLRRRGEACRLVGRVVRGRRGVRFRAAARPRPARGGTRA